MISLYMVRHGSTKFDELDKLQGQIDSPLTKEGCADAHVIGKMLRNVSIDVIYSSDLQRARRTAEIIRKTLRFKKQVITSRALREINFGKATGLDRSQVQKQYPHYKKKASCIFPGGESYVQVQKRVLRFVRVLEKKHKGKTVLLVTHRNCIRSLVSITKSRLQRNLSLPIGHRFLANIVLKNGKKVYYKQLYG